jgi:hypothetical protein
MSRSAQESLARAIIEMPGKRLSWIRSQARSLQHFPHMMRQLCAI